MAPVRTALEMARDFLDDDDGPPEAPPLPQEDREGHARGSTYKSIPGRPCGLDDDDGDAFADDLDAAPPQPAIIRHHGAPPGPSAAQRLAALRARVSARSGCSL